MKKEDLRIVFLGTPDFAVESLDRIVKEGFNVVGVVTMPDKAAGRGHKFLHSPVKAYALEHNLKLLQPVNLKDLEFVEELRGLQANLFVVIAFRMLPEVVWRMPELGTFNLHASLLPDYRGAAPINWAVINGDTRTGVTTFFLKHEIDTGDILRQESVDINPEDNVGDVHDRLMKLGAELTVDTLNHILSGDLKPVAQESLYKPGVTPRQAPKIFKETCRIDWNRPAVEIHNLVRGLSPYPAAWTVIRGESQLDGLQVKIFSTEVLPAGTACKLEPGRITVEGQQMKVDASDGVILIKELQLQGKKRMPACDFMRGARITDARFE